MIFLFLRRFYCVSVFSSKGVDWGAVLDFNDLRGKRICYLSQGGLKSADFSEDIIQSAYVERPMFYVPAQNS